MNMYNNNIKIIKCSIPEVSISTKYEWTIKINKKNITNTQIYSLDDISLVHKYYEKDNDCFTIYTPEYTKTPYKYIMKLNYFGKNIDIFNNVMSIPFQKINQVSIQNWIQYKLKNNTNDLIDTEAKYKSYAELNGLPLSEQLEMKIYSYNWIKFLRPDYEEYVKNYYNPIQLKELKVKNINEYIKRLITDNKIPSVELINNGLFNISNEHFNLENIYHIVKKKKY